MLPLPSLEHLTIFYEAPAKWNPNASVQRYVDGTKASLEDVLKEFRSGKIKNVEVCVTSEAEKEKKKQTLNNPQMWNEVNVALEEVVLRNAV